MENSKEKHPVPESVQKYLFEKLDPDLVEILIEIIESGENKIDVKSMIFYFREKMRIFEQVKLILL